MSSNSPQDRAFQVIGARNIWEQRQRLYFQMRHDGLPRLRKPFQNCADAHFPLVDMTIGDLKPFWMSQVFSGNRIADFISEKQELGATAEAAADFLDYDLRHRAGKGAGDFRYRMEQCVDKMLLCGRSIFKAVWDPFKNGGKGGIVMKAIDPQFILIGEEFDDLDEADWYIEVQTLTVEQYLRNRKFNHDKGIIDKIRGKGDWTTNQFYIEKKLREGITHSTREDFIVLWNRYEQTQSGWNLEVHCPFEWDVEICDAQRVPYEWDGQTLLPHYSMTMEIKDEGWYAPRGIAELNAAFEAYCTKLWNEKSDAMTFGNRPMFTSEKEILNVANFKGMPGEYVPGNLQAIQMPPPAFSFAEEINFTRSLSERRSRTPDFGQFAPEESGQGQKPITATQSRISAGLQAVGADHNGDTFREVRLSKILRHLWALNVQFKPSRVTYFIGGELKQLPEQAMHDQYLVIPAGGNGTKQERLQRAVARFQLFKGAPNIDQDELATGVIAADDARLVTKLVIPQAQKAQSEQFQEDVELIVLSAGRPVPVLAGQDHATRIGEIIGYLHKQHVTGAPMDPIAQQRILQHLAQHFEYLQKFQPEVAKQFKQQIMSMEQQATQPNNVAQLPQEAMAQ